MANKPLPGSTMEELARKLTGWIKEQVVTAHRDGAVIGLSGGVDSSVVAVLCKMAFPTSTLSVLMPCYNSKLDTEHAQAVAQKFGIPTVTVVLDRVFDLLMKTLPQQVPEPSTQRLASANLKPRLRMLTLYYLANSHNYLVVGTGNRSELAVGYFTKYGDGGVDILPLGNLVKAQVKDLARFLGIPGEIIDKPPSGGLWEGQTDEGELGITYQELDSYLLGKQASDKARKRIETLIQGSAHKKRLPPIPPW